MIVMVVLLLVLLIGAIERNTDRVVDALYKDKYNDFEDEL